jgi:PKD repeat protein
MKYLSRRYFKFIFIYVGIIFALSIIHWDGAGILLKSSLAEAADTPIGFTIDNPGIRKAIEVQNRNKERLMRIPGVVGIGTGIGANGQPIIRVFTKRAGIPDIPRNFEDIPVQIKVTGMFVAYSDPTGRFDRPVPIGVSTGHPDITAGTLGARVIDEYGNVYALSNNHVYANINSANFGDSALQPGDFDGGIDPNDKIGELCDYEPIDFSLFGSNTIDAAIACTTTDEVGNTTLPDGYGTPNSIIFDDDNSDGFFDNLNDLLHQPVQKFGRTTCLTHGRVTEINVTSAVCYDKCSHPFRAKLAWFDDQIAIESINNDAFSMGGDSGSLIVTDDENKNPVGLLFAGSSTTTLANRIDLVLKQFNVSVDDGSSPGNVSPTANFSTSTSELTVTFTDSSNDLDGEIISWAWDFGDDNTSTNQNPTHEYAISGTYNVTLTVTDDGGATGSTSQEVTVSDGSVPTITLTATGKQNKKWFIINLDWSGANSSNVDILRDHNFLTTTITTSNDGTYTDKISNEGPGSYTYRVCEAGTSTCSDPETVTFY